MAFDRGHSRGVACLASIVAFGGACGPTVKPASPPSDPGPVGQTHRDLKTAPGARRVLIGEMCPQGAGGRPAIAPLVMRGVDWTDAPTEVVPTVERGAVPRFVVFGVDGNPAGAFETLGIADVGGGLSVATGTYVGASPCTYAVSAKTSGSTRGEDPACAPATFGCGIAAGEIIRPDDPPENVSFETGGACMSGNDLAVDIDGDGTIESFPIAGVLDSLRAPAEEWGASPTAMPAGAQACTPSFHVYGLKLAPEPRPGRPPDKGLVVVDVLAVADLDGDGRRELVLGMRFPTVRTIVVYTATGSAQHLEKAGEAPALGR